MANKKKGSNNSSDDEIRYYLSEASQLCLLNQKQQRYTP